MSERLAILVVDDDPGMIETLGDILEMRGYRVAAASDGSQAIDLAGEKSFDLTLMDIKMPGINGVETLKELKKIAPAMKFIMMTAYAYEHLIQEALAEGALAVLRKPLDINELLNLIETSQ